MLYQIKSYVTKNATRSTD